MLPALPPCLQMPDFGSTSGGGTARAPPASPPIAAPLLTPPCACTSSTTSTYALCCHAYRHAPACAVHSTPHGACASVAAARRPGPAPCRLPCQRQRLSANPHPADCSATQAQHGRVTPAPSTHAATLPQAAFGKAGIVPSDTATYTPQQLAAAVKAATGATPILVCFKDFRLGRWLLEEVRMCVGGKDLQVMMWARDSLPLAGHAAPT